MSRLGTLAIFSVCATLIFANSTFGGAADASVTCDKGYYLTDNGECEICPADSYCADNVRIACPDPVLHKRTTFPDYYYNPVITDIYLQPVKRRAAITSCTALCWMDSERGELYEYTGYNTNTGQYDRTSIYNWAAVKPGYYLTAPVSGECSGNYAYYKDVFECPAGHYCPGRDMVRCTAENQDTVRTPTFGLEICPAGTYSAGGASACTVCPENTWSDVGASVCDACPNIKNGYGNSGASADTHAGVASCVVQCAAGRYVPAAGLGCVNVGAGYWGAGGVADLDSTLPRNQCTDGLTTIGYGPGADEVDDCGHILHLGNNRIYLRSVKRTTPALAVEVNGTVFYGNMTSNATRSKVHVDIRGQIYSIHDDSK